MLAPMDSGRLIVSVASKGMPTILTGSFEDLPPSSMVLDDCASCTTSVSGRYRKPLCGSSARSRQGMLWK